ncbi:MAG: hypothetical protein AB8B72_10170 [Crocinitomicaceae bacterium]
MRKELIEIERIENYLMDAMSSEERTEFEMEIKSDKTLQNKVDAQQQIMIAVEKMAVKRSVKESYGSYKMKAMLTKVLLVIVGLAIAGFIALQFLDNGEEGYEAVGEIELIDSLSSQANLALDENTYLIKTNQDTVIENQDGVIIYIPANSFDTNLDEVELKVQSAINGSDIMLAGLSTMSDTNQLETGGMFYIDALADGQRVNLVKDVTVNVPTNQKVDGMQHYQGEKTASGNINWVDPKPLPKNLMPVDILTLDFYPPSYEKTLYDWSYSGKQFTDSLYYSFGFRNKVEYGLFPLASQADTTLASFNDGESEVDLSLDNSKDEWRPNYDDTEYEEIGINPTSIKSIWLRKFNNTILATKEFEERMSFIHESCNQAVLDLYINNLSLRLSEIDSMVMKLVSGNLKDKFGEFASRGDGKVKMDENACTKLNEFYGQKLRMETKAIQKTKEEFWKKQAELDAENQRKKGESIQRDLKNQGDVFIKEVKKNLCKVYEELDYPHDCNNPPPAIAAAYYTVPVRNLGWHNIDRQVKVATANRSTTTINYKGKSSTLRYEKWVGELVDYNNYERVYVYNLPNTFNSYVRINSAGQGRYDYNLNSDIDYETLVLAWKDDQFYYNQTDTKSGTEKINLKPISKASFKSKLSKRNASVSSFEKELEYIQFEQKDSKRMKRNANRRELRRKIEPVIFPCRPIAEDDLRVTEISPINE